MPLGVVSAILPRYQVGVSRCEAVMSWVILNGGEIAGMFGLSGDMIRNTDLLFVHHCRLCFTTIWPPS